MRQPKRVFSHSKLHTDVGEVLYPHSAFLSPLTSHPSPLLNLVATLKIIEKFHSKL